MKSPAITWGILTVAMLGMAACADNFPGKCDSNADCEGASECRQGLCVLVSGQTDGQDGQTYEIANLIAEPGFQQTRLRWDAVPKASLYKVYWKNSSGVSKGDKYEISETNELVHSDLNNWQSYYYAVAAVLPTGETSLSSEAWARPAPLIPNGTVYAIGQGSDGTVYIGGAFSRIGRASGNVVAWNTTRNQPIPFPLVTGTVVAIAPDGTGGWYIGGIFYGVDGIHKYGMARILADGTLDPNWKSIDPWGGVDAIAVSGETIYIGGYFTRIQGKEFKNLAAVHSDGTLDQHWKPDASGPINALSVSENGENIYVGGEFSKINGERRPNLAAIHSGGTLDPNWKPEANGRVSALIASKETVYVGGSFSKINDKPQRKLAVIKADGALEQNWNPQPDGDASALAVSGKNVLAGGEFTSIGGEPRRYLAAIKADTLDQNWNPQPDGVVSALAVSDQTVFVGGDFSKIGEVSRKKFAVINTYDGALNQNSNWDPKVDDSILALAVRGKSIYVGGKFSTIGGVARKYLAVINADDGALNPNWNPNSDGPVSALAISGETIYVGGEFENISGGSKKYLAAIKTTDGSLDPNWNPNPDGAVSALAVNGETVYVAGNFSNIGGGPKKFLAAIFADGTGTLNQDWNLPYIYSPVVSALAASGKTLFLGGSFVSIDHHFPQARFTNLRLP